MFFFTIWGGAEVRPKDPDNIVVTVWGGTDILLPTLAEKIVRLKKARTDYGEITDSVIRRTNVITLMGGTIYKAPTLAKEIEQMKQLKDSGSISEGEMFQLWQEAIRREDMDVFESLTIMGGCGDEGPDKKEELKDLARIAARGVISAGEYQEFRDLLEKKNSVAGEDLQQKLLRMLQPSQQEFPSLKNSTKASSALLE
ncbi:hypothetical protein L0222_30340 [bacterium]|nr:hypothetical protein [bacterium]MCI0602282.1 hypothetical protein [bacterium]